MAVNHGPHADARIGVDLQTRRGMKRAFPRMVGEVCDPRVEQVGQELEEWPAGVELADAVLHVGTHPLTADVGDERVEVALVREVLEKASLGDSGASSDDVQAAA